MIAVEKSLDVEKVRVERLEHKLAGEAEKWQQFLSKNRKAILTTSQPLAEDKDFLRDLQLKVAAMTAERNEWYKLASEETETLNVASADGALQSKLWKAALEAMDTHTIEITSYRIIYLLRVPGCDSCQKSIMS